MSSKSYLNAILGRSILENPYVVTSHVHLQITYYNNTKKPVVIHTDSKVARRVHKFILKNLLTLDVAEKGQWKSNIL